MSLLTRQAQSSQQAQAHEIFVYDIQTGTISICSFGDAPAAPQQHFWDAEHPLLLACELAKTHTAQRKSKAATAEDTGLEVATLFATPQGIVLQDCSTLQACQVQPSHCAFNRREECSHLCCACHTVLLVFICVCLCKCSASYCTHGLDLPWYQGLVANARTRGQAGSADISSCLMQDSSTPCIYMAHASRTY